MGSMVSGFKVQRVQRFTVQRLAVQRVVASRINRPRLQPARCPSVFPFFRLFQSPKPKSISNFSKASISNGLGMTNILLLSIARAKFR